MAILSVPLPNRALASRVCHLTSVHPRYDTRIFAKECRSLVHAGFSVTLIVADGKGDETRDGVRIVDAGSRRGRLARMLRTTRDVYRKALEVGADIYHFHDPELIPIGRRLQRRGKRIIYDVHEDVPRQILGKHYLSPWLRPVVSRLVETYENRMIRRFDYVIAAYPYLLKRIEALTPKSCDVTNYPILGDFRGIEARADGERAVCYIGSITRSRGILELIDSLDLADVTLHLGGEFSPPELRAEVERRPGWRRVTYHGFVSRPAALAIYSRVRAGIATLHPVGHYPTALAVKMFEYMAAGLPVICSDFPLWKQIVSEAQCGLTVDPSNPEAIAAGIRHVLSHREEALRMGRNGRRAVERTYNWGVEEVKLVETYRLLSAPRLAGRASSAGQAGASRTSRAG